MNLRATRGHRMRRLSPETNRSDEVDKVDVELLSGSHQFSRKLRHTLLDKTVQIFPKVTLLEGSVSA